MIGYRFNLKTVVVLLPAVFLLLIVSAQPVGSEVPLVSEPVMGWNTFMGSPIATREEGRGIAVDSSGNVYIAGRSDAIWGSPVNSHSGDDDGFVAKLNSSGTLLWNTFMGSASYDIINAIAVDSSGNVYVAGCSAATWGSPVNGHAGGGNSAFPPGDAFVAKLNSSGTLLWNTFMGSASFDYGNGIAVDSSGNAYVAGYSVATWGSPVNPYSGYHDSFTAKLSSSGTLLWNTFMGSASSENGNAIAVDSSGNVYVAGRGLVTWGAPVNSPSGYVDSFVTKLNSSGSRLWNTFMGSEDYDIGNGIAVDSSGNVYAAGLSDATWGSPVNSHSGGYDAFVVKLNSSGSRLWNTFMGSASRDEGHGIAVDSSGNVYVAGESYGTWGSPVNPHSGSHDAFVVKLLIKNEVVKDFDILLVLPAILAASKRIDDPLERSLTAAYVLHPVDSEIFTTLQLVVLAKMYMDFTSPRHPNLSQPEPFDPNIIDRAKTNALRILNSSDPIGKANALLQLGMPVSTVSFLRPYARTALSREETISGLDRVFMESVREAISATNSRSQSLNSKSAKITANQDPQTGWVSLGGNGPVRGKGGTSAEPYDGGHFYRGVKYFRTFMEDFYKDCFDELAKIALENALKDMSEVFGTAAPGAVDFVVSIGKNVKATLTAYSVGDRVEAVWNHFKSLADFSGNVGEQLGEAMVKGAKDLAEIEFDGDSIPPVPAEVYRYYSYNNVPLDNLLSNTDYSQWEWKHWNIQPPVVSYSPNPFYQISPPGTGTGSVSRVTRTVPPGGPYLVSFFATYDSEDMNKTISRCLINGEVVSSYRGSYAYYNSADGPDWVYYPEGTQLTLEIYGGKLDCCAHISIFDGGWVHLYRYSCPGCDGITF